MNTIEIENGRATVNAVPIEGLDLTEIPHGAAYHRSPNRSWSKFCIVEGGKKKAAIGAELDLLLEIEGVILIKAVEAMAESRIAREVPATTQIQKLGDAAQAIGGVVDALLQSLGDWSTGDGTLAALKTINFATLQAGLDPIRPLILQKAWIDATLAHAVALVAEIENESEPNQGEPNLVAGTGGNITEGWPVFLEED